MNKSLPGSHNIIRKQLPNGITLLVHHNPYSQSQALNAYLRRGSYLDPRGKNGLAAFSAESLLFGMGDWGFDEIHSRLERCGASLHCSAGPHTTSVNGRCLAEDLPMLLTMLRMMFDRPHFPANYCEMLRQQKLTACELRRYDTGSMASIGFERLLYGADHPYGVVFDGDEESLPAITLADLSAFAADHYGPEGLVICLAGGAEPQSVLDMAGEILGDWRKPQVSVDETAYFPTFSVPSAGIREHTEIPEMSEMSLVVGTEGPAFTDPQFLSAMVGNCILGQFGMMGRIGKTVRDDNGLAYYAGSSLTALTRGGSWEVNAGVNPANAEKALDLIFKELKRFTAERVTEEELADAQSYLVGSMPLSLESNRGFAGSMRSVAFYDLDLDYYQTLGARTWAVSRDEVLETARMYLDLDRMVTVSAGTKDLNALC